MIPHVPWEEYEQLLEDLGESPHLRVTYDEGRLEIMTISDEHDEYKDSILRLAQVISEELAIPLETRGSATRKQQSLQKGTEPDASSYVANAQQRLARRG